jgi:hypothetical protein
MPERPKLTEDIAERIGERIAALCGLRTERSNNDYLTRDGRMPKAVLGHRELRLIDEAFAPETTAPPPPAKAMKQRHENSWTVVQMACDRAGGLMPAMAACGHIHLPVAAGADLWLRSKAH